MGKDEYAWLDQALYTRAQAMKILGIGKTHMQELLNTGVLEAALVGAKEAGTRITRDSMVRYLKTLSKYNVDEARRDHFRGLRAKHPKKPKGTPKASPPA